MSIERVLAQTFGVFEKTFELSHKRKLTLRLHPFGKVELDCAQEGHPTYRMEWVDGEIQSWPVRWPEFYDIPRMLSTNSEGLVIHENLERGIYAVTFDGEYIELNDPNMPDAFWDFLLSGHIWFRNNTFGRIG